MREHTEALSCLRAGLPPAVAPAATASSRSSSRRSRPGRRSSRGTAELGGHADGARDVIDQAGAGIAPALQTLREAADALGSAIGQLINILDPEAVVVGGGLGATPGAYWDALVPAVRAHIWWDGARDIPILQTSLGADAGALGAALGARALLTR